MLSQSDVDSCSGQSTEPGQDFDSKSTSSCFDPAVPTRKTDKTSPLAPSPTTADSNAMPTTIEDLRNISRPCPFEARGQQCTHCKFFWGPYFKEEPQHKYKGCTKPACTRCHDVEHIPETWWVQLHVRRTRTARKQQKRLHREQAVEVTTLETDEDVVLRNIGGGEAIRCSLADMPEPLTEHSSDGNISEQICGTIVCEGDRHLARADVVPEMALATAGGLQLSLMPGIGMLFPSRQCVPNFDASAYSPEVRAQLNDVLTKAMPDHYED